MTVPDKLLLIAVFVQVALTFALLLRLGSLRVPLVSEGKVDMNSIALSRDAWPEKVKQLGNALDNQFQLPVLFYVAAALTLHVGGATWLEVLFGWLFVLLRIAHAFVHITDNDVPRRFVTYTAGFAVLIAFWLLLLMRVVVAGAP
jgi:hypothetical protein